MKTDNYFRTHLLHLLVIVQIFSIGCSSNEEQIPVTTKVHGYLMVRGSGEIINDRSYKIGLAPSGTRSESHMYEITFTDSNGYYEFSHESSMDKRGYGEDMYSLAFLDNVPDGTFISNSRFILVSGNGSRFSQTFPSGFQGEAHLSLSKKAWVDLHIESLNPDQGDKIRIHFIPWNYQATIISHRIILPGVGNWANELIYWIYKNGEWSDRYSTGIHLDEMDTAYFKLEY
ncbi:MAG: hypothetical protein JJU02_04080 [Cryomorphaceae bacterium]|nr:hypothetical protein [Cryomorphaceae bacterium]